MKNSRTIFSVVLAILLFVSLSCSMLRDKFAGGRGKEIVTAKR